MELLVGECNKVFDEFMNIAPTMIERAASSSW